MTIRDSRNSAKTFGAEPTLKDKKLLSIPESVFAYLTQQEVRTAVNLLASKKKPPVPEEVRWNDLESFYRGVLSMQQVQAEFAMTLAKLWQETWGQVDIDWSSGSPQEPGEDGSLDVGEIWRENCFTRVFGKDVFVCHLCSYATYDEGLQLGFAIWKGEDDKKILKKMEVEGWEYDDEFGYMWTTADLRPREREMDLLPLVEAARNAEDVWRNL